ncbi:MAG: T9SS type A sorting domain-containing protein [Chitinophagaceae bacterium]|nr:T9SS type A sorting domain-containing protein [Chitinophagaceae bacterium]
MTATATPTVTQTTLYNSTTIVSGTAVANSTVRLYTNGVLTASTTAAGGAYTFSNLSFSNNDVVVIIAQAAGNCVSTAVSKTVVCFTNPPIILADGNNQITANLPITGTSGDGVGTVIRVYSTPATLVATTTVQANGTWSTDNVGTLPATYNAIAATSYYATAQNGSCGVSQASATYIAAGATSTGRCGSISGTPIGSGAVSISGTLTGSFATTTVNLYLDGVLIGSTTTSGTSWGPITVNNTPTNTLYSNGILTIGVQESGKQEAACAASAATIVCSPTPAAALISPVDTTIVTNETVTYTISNAVTGTFYALADSATGSSLGVGKWATANGNLQLTTVPYLIMGIYKVAVKATSLSGITTCISPEAIGAVTVDDIILPLSLISFSGRKTERNILLEWSTENEYEMSKFEIESSYDAIHFELIGQCVAKGNQGKTLYFFKDDKFYNKDVFYRLKMINNDGTFKYSKIINIKLKNIGVISKISPNPFVDKIQVEIIADNAQQAFADLIDNTGRTLFTKTFHINAGPNIILFDKLDKLSKGTYIISIKINNTIIKHRILKIK